VKIAMLDSAREAPAKARGGVVGWWNRSRTFLTQVRNELERVTWPTRKEVYATTLVVILTSILFGVYLWGIDLILSALVRFVYRVLGVA
jgi:preprotein translocase subunit SecE